MRVFQIYNEQRSRFGGEPAVIEATMRVLAQHGHESRLIKKSSRILERSLIKRVFAFWGGIYNIRSYFEMLRLIKADRPDLVHVHSVYPMFSPSILVACRRAGIPVVMTVHSHNLTCPTWFHLRNGKICDACFGGREYHCVRKNCRNNILESMAYALRAAIARRFRWFHDNVDVLIVLTPFSKERLVRAGFREQQVAVVPNPTVVSGKSEPRRPGDYVAFAGRVSPEKGLGVFLAAASSVPHVTFKVAGDGPLLAEMKAIAPTNVKFLGKLEFEDLKALYRNSRLLAVPSLGYELFGMVVVDAMALGVPVIASRIGGLPYVVEDGVTGLLFEPGNAAELAEQVRRLWEDPALCARLGKAGQQRVQEHYTQKCYYENLMRVYGTAIQRRQTSRAISPQS